MGVERDEAAGNGAGEQRNTPHNSMELISLRKLVHGQRDVIFRVAIVCWIVRDRFRDRSSLNGELERFLGHIGQAGDAGFAVAVRADLELGLPLAEESVLNEDVNLGVVDRLVRAISHGEIRAAGTETAVHGGNLRRLGGEQGTAEKKRNCRAKKAN